MEIESTPWFETRSLVPPELEMLQSEGMIQHKKSFLRTQSPKSATPKFRFIHYNQNYVKYSFLKEFYQFLFDLRNSGVTINDGDGDVLNFDDGSQHEAIINILRETISDFSVHCNLELTESNSKELFRTFCQLHLFH